jgi:hypothetical protein
VAKGSAAQGEISYGERRRAALTDQVFLHSYTFTGKAGDAIALSVRAEGFDAYLELLDADGKLIAVNDDIGAPTETLAATDARIAGFVLPQDGRYTVRVTRFGRETARGAFGAYELQLSRAE